MKTSILNRNGISLQVINLIGRLIDLIPWPQRRVNGLEKFYHFGSRKVYHVPLAVNLTS
jgi:hypothetical protein